MRNSRWKRCVAGMLAACLVMTGVNVYQADAANENAQSYDGALVKSASGALGENAQIEGEKTALEEEKGSKVLVLGGGYAKAGTLQLPSDMYKNVTEGFTITMDVYVEEGAEDYTRLLQSSPCEPGLSGAPWQSPSISIDLGAGDCWRTEVFVGENGQPNSTAESMTGATAQKAVARGVWHSVSMSVHKSGYTLLVDGETLIEQTGDFSKLFGETGYLSAYVNNAIGDSIYTDSSIKAKIDNVKLYNSAETIDDTTLQFFYDFESVELTEKEQSVGGEDIYTDGTKLSALTEIASPNQSVVTKLWKDDKNRYFYSVSRDGVCVIYASAVGLVTSETDFTEGASYEAGTVEKVTDTYTLYSGKQTGEITDICNEYSFLLKKDGKELTVTFRVYDDGMAYRYSMEEGAQIKSEASEFVFSDDSTLWSYTQPNVTYEGTYTQIPMTTVFNTQGTYTTPSLVKSDDTWILLTEASVFDDEESYCSSYLRTDKNSKNLRWVFGNKQATNVVMKNAFATPWRTAVIGGDLNTIVSSHVVTSLCEDAADADYSFVKPGRLAWSWWSSTGDDPIAFEPQFAYIDFAAENGWEYVCLDYGWVLWENYKDKVKELVEYAEERGVGIWLWYGVNNVGHAAAGAYPKYSLLNEETIRTELTWASETGVKGVKVDYYESDNTETMKQMYLCAKIALDNEIMVLFHGCTNPGGEERTFPNILSYEAVYGAEYYKWRNEPSTANIITYLFTRNAIGSADFTPTAMPVANIDATYGFMLGTVIYLESGLIHFAENVNVYEGYAGLSLMNDIPVSWEESYVLEGNPGDYGTVARRQGDDWYMAGLTTGSRTTDISLDFLEEGKEYTAYIYGTNENNSGIEITTKQVKKGDTLTLELRRNDGFAAKLTTEKFDYTTSYEKNYTYYEAEKAELSGKAALSTNLVNAQYASGGRLAEYIGSGRENAVTYTVEAPKAGVYGLQVYYVSGNERRFEICINGDYDSRIRTGKLYSGDWVTVDKETLYIELKKGENTITFYNDEAYAPNLDRIALSKATVDEKVTESDETKDESDEHEGASYEYDIYEAERATIAGGATNEGYYAGWIGGSGYVSFDNVQVEKAGKYYLKITYMTGADRDFAVSVNGAENIIISCPSSGDYFTNPSVAYLEIELKEGTNTIKMSNPSGDAPNLDSIGISKTVIGEKETEAAVQETKPEGNNTVLIIVIVVVVCIVIAAAVIFIIIRKKKKGK